MYLLTEWEGRTGKYLARGNYVRIGQAHVNPSDHTHVSFHYGFSIGWLERGRTGHMIN